jgi:nucleoside 2-deoxyribosyltransferase
MGVLRGKRCYLSGPIQYDDTGHNWREGPRKVLVEEFGIDLFDPFEDPKQQWVPLLMDAQKRKDYDTMQRISRQFVRKDLCMVDRSDFIISYLPHKMPTTGTHHEIINSVNAKKPTLLVCPQGKEYVPLWYYGFIPHEVMFGGWEDVYQYLRDVDAMKHTGNNRWAYVYGLV